MRARSLKPGFFTNEILGEADPLISILFAGLWGLADREGRLEDRPLRIYAQVMAVRPRATPKLVDQWLAWLHEQNFIRRYSVASNRYIQVMEFSKHQYPHFKEPPSKIPALSPTLPEAKPEARPQTGTGPCPADSGLRTPDSGLLTPDSHPPGGKNQEPPHPTAEPVGSGPVDTGGPVRRQNGTSPRQTGTNPRSLGTNPRRREAADARTINSICMKAWARACELIAEIYGKPGRTWAEAVDQKFPHLTAAINAAGGHKAIAQRDRFTTSQLKSEFCTAYRIAFEGAPRDNTGPKSAAAVLEGMGLKHP